MNKYKKLFSNTAIIAMGTFGSKILVFLLLPLYTAKLSPEEYGIADIITQSANLLMPVLALNIYDAVFRFILDRNANRRQVMTTGLAVILAGTLFFGVLTPVFELIDYFEGYAWLIILYTVAACLHALFAQYVRGIGLTTVYAVQGIAATAIIIILNILFLVVFKIGLIGYVLSVVISDVVVSVGLIYVASIDKIIRPKYFNSALMKEMLGFSVPLIPTTVFWWITNVSDRYMIKGMLGNDINGLYAAAFKIPTILILLSGIFIEAWQFSAVTERDSATKREHSLFFGKVFDSFQGLLFISAACLIAFSKLFSLILFADSYYTAWQYMPLLTAATVYSSLVTFMGSVYLVDKKSILSFATAFVGALVNIVLNLILIPSKMGANGAALATFFSYFIVFILRSMNTKKFIPFNLHEKKLAINTAIIMLQSVAMIFEWCLWLPLQMIAVAAIFVINSKPIINGASKIISGRKLPLRKGK